MRHTAMFCRLQLLTALEFENDVRNQYTNNVSITNFLSQYRTVICTRRIFHTRVAYANFTRYHMGCVYPLLLILDHHIFRSIAEYK